MIEQRATVISVDDTCVVVEVERKSVCSSCHVSSGCGTSLLDKLFPGRASQIRIMSGGRELNPGQVVMLGINETSFLHAAFSMYLLPLLIMFAFAIAGTWLFNGSAAGETPVIIFASIGLFAGFLLVKYMFGKNTRHKSGDIVILGDNANTSRYVKMS